MDQVSAFRRVEGERQMREGERIKMLGEFKVGNVEGYLGHAVASGTLHMHRTSFGTVARNYSNSTALCCTWADAVLGAKCPLERHIPACLLTSHARSSPGNSQ